MKKAIDSIQRIMKLGKILSKIFFIVSVVCVAILVAMLIVILALSSTSSFTLETSNLLVKFDMTERGAYASLIVAIIMLAGETFLAKKAGDYFSHEMKAGTPFTESGADELKRLSSFVFWVPILTTILSIIVYVVAKETGYIDVSIGFPVGLAIMFYIVSLFCRYALESKKEEDSTN